MAERVADRALVISFCLLAAAGCATVAPSPSPSPPPLLQSAQAPAPATAPLAVASQPRVTPASEKPPIAAREIAAAAHAAFNRGIEWALTNQRDNGAWGSFETARISEVFLDTQASHRAFGTATSALVAWSLIEPARTDARCRTALERGLADLLSRDPTGRASGKTFYSVWAHTYMLELAAAVLRDETLAQFHEPMRARIAKELLLVRREQGTEGGWGYYDFTFTGINPSGNESTSFNTAAMIFAMKAAEAQGGSVPEGTYEDATRAILRMKLPSGTFAYGTYAQLAPRADYNKVSGSSGRLQSCNVALHAVNAGDVTPEVLLRGVQHLRDTHQYIEVGRGRTRPHEAFYRTSGYYYYFGHYYAACALALVPPSAERAELIRWLAQVMVHDQNPDGSWFDYPLYNYGRAYGTGFALLTLETLKPLIEELFR